MNLRWVIVVVLLKDITVTAFEAYEAGVRGPVHHLGKPTSYPSFREHSSGHINVECQIKCPVMGNLINA